MNEKVEKFLVFNGKTIVLQAKDGMWWIALKPICEALGVNYETHVAGTYKKRILSKLRYKHLAIAVDGKLRNMICLPEFAIYGWIFQIESSAVGLKEFQWECYSLLFDHFHGATTKGRKLIMQKVETHIMIDNLRNKAFATSEAREIESLELHQKETDRQLKHLDNEQFDLEIDLFKQNLETQSTEQA